MMVFVVICIWLVVAAVWSLLAIFAAALTEDGLDADSDGRVITVAIASGMLAGMAATMLTRDIYQWVLA
ncbi:hypothetical protein Q7C18_02930 [Nesterenkonia sp. CL21]|uniref:hypothetical protein n=1 Tax=Nesterenkonia sp. CL21 TaxID=3064894 RepID=UPI00287AEAE1|nr:hypothetical protein [Nesterenkonia sp. CL21]MDS2171642.1 hypothetical protein [Nesterenkonia sp. CL21]